MGEPTGFIKYQRRVAGKEPAQERIKHYNEFLAILPAEELALQGARCMDCGVPFCHAGCPLGNIIPDFNDLVYREDWQEAASISTRRPAGTPRIWWIFSMPILEAWMRS